MLGMGRRSNGARLGTVETSFLQWLKPFLLGLIYVRAESLKEMDRWSGALADMGCSRAALVNGKGGACVEWQIASSE
jgi:hypothetical protein